MLNPEGESNAAIIYPTIKGNVSEDSTVEWRCGDNLKYRTDLGRS